jgi:CheY-like chemotaxis protein
MGAPPTRFLLSFESCNTAALKDAGVECELVLFEDGREIVDHVRNAGSLPPQMPPELILLDLNLPKNDGLEILQVIRDAPAFAKVSIIVLSSSSSLRERGKLAAFQIREFIVKPPDLDEYLKIGKIVQNLLDEATSQQGGSATSVVVAGE